MLPVCRRVQIGRFGGIRGHACLVRDKHRGSKHVNILFIGDIVGRPGRTCVKELLPALRRRETVDFVIANGENAAGGLGITPKLIEELVEFGVDAITLGNHTWKQKELAGELDNFPQVVRPANYPEGVPGRGSALIERGDGPEVGIVNLVGRVYLDPSECPFVRACKELDELRKHTRILIVDFHAEATSEKIAMGWHLDGRCSAVIGTHTHVQTADERVLPEGTAYITDAGMTGPVDSVLGVDRGPVIDRFLTGMPHELRVAKGYAMLCGVIVDIDEHSGRAKDIERVGVCTKT